MLNIRAFFVIVLSINIMVFFSPEVASSLPTVGAAPKTDDPKNDSSNPQSWLGKNFVVLDMPKSLQHYGYMEMRIHRDPYTNQKNSNYEGEVGWLLYDKFVGDVLTVTAVDVVSNFSTALPTEYDVVFNDDTKNIPVFAKTSDGRIKNIAPIEELTMVKKSWTGKKIWSKSRSLEQYDAQSGTGSAITIPLGECLTVMDVVWGTDTQNPVWVIVKDETGVTGFYEIAGSPTNKDTIVRRMEDNIFGRSNGTLTRDHIDYWNTKFYDHNPQKDYSWSQAVWNKVCKGEVSIGMTKPQVSLALDLPEQINRDTYAGGATEQWTYSNRNVYFANDKVKEIQDR